MSTPRTDIAIVGGGIVGATLALLLAERGVAEPARITLLEPSPPPPPRADAPPEVRVSAIASGHCDLLRRLGVWQALDARRIAPYERMVVWHEAVPPDSPDALRLDAAETGAPDLGVILENTHLQWHLLQRCDAVGIRRSAEPLRGLAIAPGGVTLQLAGGALEAELVVGADGAASAVRGMLGLPVRQHGYGQRAIVATLGTARPHGGTAWQRFLSTGPVALLPLPGQRVSLVWSAEEARADTLLALPDATFEAEVTAASAGVLGALTLQGPRAAFPLRRLAAQAYVCYRAALVGDAAHVIHPLAGQGVNQGLSDVVALTAQLAARPPRESVGALRALQAYERERRAGNALMGGVVDGLDGLFTGRPGVKSWLAREGMALVGRSALARRALVGAAAGPGSPRPQAP